MRYLSDGSTVLPEGVPGKFRGRIYPAGWTLDGLSEKVREQVAESLQDEAPAPKPERRVSLPELRVWIEENPTEGAALAKIIDSLPRSSAWIDRLDAGLTSEQMTAFIDAAGKEPEVISDAKVSVDRLEESKIEQTEVVEQKGR